MSPLPNIPSPASPPLVYVVDDHDMTLNLLLGSLRHEGLVAVGSTSAEEALPKIAELRPSLVLMDSRLPGMNGEEAIRRLREDPATSHIPVVLCTAYLASADRAALVDAGVIEIFDKPFRMSELRDLIARHLPHAPSVRR
jgi:CheY-like chemotaxis protein